MAADPEEHPTGVDDDALDRFERAFEQAMAADDGDATDLDARIDGIPDVPRRAPGPRRVLRAAPVDEGDPSPEPVAPDPADYAGGAPTLEAVLSALAVIEARIVRVEESVSGEGAVGLVRTSHQTLIRKLTEQNREVLDAIEALGRRIDELAAGHESGD